MSAFDKLAGIAESYTRRPLKTLGEAGGDKKSTPAATMDYGSPPREFEHGSPNTAFRPCPKPAFGGDGTMKGKVSAAALRTKKPYQHGAG
jgi:hypothetical protein